MKQLFGIGLLGLLIIGCTNPTEKETPNEGLPTSVIDTVNSVLVDDKDSLFVMHDSLAIVGQKIGPQLFNMSIQINRKGSWFEVQRFDSLFQFNGFYPEALDMDGDGYTDLSIFRTTGVRGGNSFSYVYLYKPLTGRFVFLKGSDYKPNLIYNDKKQMIEGMGYDAAIHYTWFKIVNDSLVPVERLDHEAVELKKGTYIKDTYYKIDSLGKFTVLYLDSTKIGERQSEFDIMSSMVAPRD